MSTALTMQTQCLRSGPNAMSSTWLTMMATAHATTLPKASNVGSATGRTLRTDRSSFQRSSSSSLPSPWALSSDRAESTTTSVSHDFWAHSIPVSYNAFSAAGHRLSTRGMGHHSNLPCHFGVLKKLANPIDEDT